MLKELLLNQYNLQIFNYSFIFKNFVERNFINDLHSYGLLEKKKDSTARRLFIHHNIHSVCEFILKSRKKGKQIIYFDYNNLLDGEILDYIDESRLKSYLNYAYLKIRTLLPVRVFYSTFSLDYLNAKHQQNTGLSKETILKIKSLAEDCAFESFTFEKIRKFVKKEQLTFLDKTYFNSLKSKQLLIN
jgi:hypothetical protein